MDSKNTHNVSKNFGEGFDLVWEGFDLGRLDKKFLGFMDKSFLGFGMGSEL